jgi:hypothetical protein
MKQDKRRFAHFDSPEDAFDFSQRLLQKTQVGLDEIGIFIF